jgi:multidrug efflux pump
MIWNFTIRRPVLTIVVFVIMGIFGIYGAMQMPVQEQPDVDFPIVSVQVALAGAAPEVIETEVIDPLEAEINTIEGLRTLRSSSREQGGNITAEFELWRDIDLAAQDVRDAVERARRALPEDADPPIVQKVDIGSQAIMWVALIGDERWDDVRLTDYADNVMRQQLESLKGVGRVQVGGERKYAVRIRLDPERLAAHHITVQDVVDRIRQENVDIPSGRIEGPTREFLVRTRGQFAAAEPFNDLIIAHRNGAPVRLIDVGEAVDGIEEDRRIARFTGEKSIGLGIVRQTGANVVEVASLVRERVDELSQTFPAGLEYRISTDGSVYVRENIRDLVLTIFMATALVVAIVLIFLQSVRGTIVAAIAIPTSLLVGLALINVFGFSLNVLTMLGLILVIGIVVDDAIVVLERTYWHMESGADPVPAARVGTTEMAFPTIANSLALGAVFLPVAFTGGLIGRFFLEFGVTVAVTVFASTLVALTLTPVMASRLLRYSPKRPLVYRPAEVTIKALERAYVGTLNVAFRYRPMTLLIGIAAFGLGILAAMNVRSEFAPMEDRSQFMVIFETAEGSTLDVTDQFAKKIEEVYFSVDEVSHWFLAIGLARGGPGQANRGISFVRLVPRNQRERHQEQIMQEVRQRLGRIPDGRAFVIELVPGGMGGSPIEAVIQHPSLETLDDLQHRIMAWMRERSDMYVGVRSDLELANPQIEVAVDRDRAAELGVSVAEVSNTMRFLFGGPQISRIVRDAKQYDVIPDVFGRGSLTPEAISNLYVRTQDGDLVSMDGLVRFIENVGPSEINRYNRMRSTTISAQTPPGVALGDAVADLEAYLRNELPADARYDLAGFSEMYEESFYYLTIALVLSLIFIYLVLAAQFESLLLPIAIMMALPLATTGAFGSLWLLDMPLSIFAFIGLIMLLGLVTKNSILLVDYTNVLIARGYSTIDAAKEAGKDRFRPVLMTAFSTMLGMMPIAVGFGAGGEVRSPLGVSVAAGLFTSTALTLIVIPVVFSYTVQLRDWVTGRAKAQEFPSLGIQREGASA